MELDSFYVMNVLLAEIVLNSPSVTRPHTAPVSVMSSTELKFDRKGRGEWRGKRVQRNPVCGRYRFVGRCQCSVRHRMEKIGVYQRTSLSNESNEKGSYGVGEKGTLNAFTKNIWNEVHEDKICGWSQWKLQYVHLTEGVGTVVDRRKRSNCVRQEGW